MSKKTSSTLMNTWIDRLGSCTFAISRSPIRKKPNYLDLFLVISQTSL